MALLPKSSNITMQKGSTGTPSIFIMNCNAPIRCPIMPEVIFEWPSALRDREATIDKDQLFMFSLMPSHCVNNESVCEKDQWVLQH